MTDLKTIMPRTVVIMVALPIVHLGTSPIVVATGKIQKGGGGGGGPNQHDFFVYTVVGPLIIFLDLPIITYYMYDHTTCY